MGRCELHALPQARRKWRAVDLEERSAAQVQGRLLSRPQLELFEELTKQRRVRKLDAVRSTLRAADKSLCAPNRGR